MQHPTAESSRSSQYTLKRKSMRIGRKSKCGTGEEYEVGPGIEEQRVTTGRRRAAAVVDHGGARSTRHVLGGAAGNRVEKRVRSTLEDLLSDAGLFGRARQRSARREAGATLLVLGDRIDGNHAVIGQP